MKGKFKKIGIAALALLGTISLASCGGDDEAPYDPFTLEEFQAYATADLANVLKSCGHQTEHSATVWSNLQSEYNKGLAAIKAATTKEAATAAVETAKNAMASAIPYANGDYSFASASYDERTEILGVLEAFAVRNGMTGISLFEDGNYVMYNERLTLGTENYIPGYGFGILSEGSVNADLDSETNASWKRYLHTIEASDPGTINYLNDKGSQIGDLYSYISGGFFTNFMNETKDGYEWTPELANERPVAVNPDSAGMSTKWRFTVKTGENADLKYTTLSTKSDRSNFNNRPVALADYETPFKFLLTQKNGLARGAEMAGDTGASAIRGAADYYAASKEGFNASAWSKVGIKTYTENDKDYFEFEFVDKVSSFYAMYYITSGLYQPIPQDFLDLTGDTYCGYNADKSYTPVDNSLSLGAYTLEHWETDKQIVFKKNANYVFADKKYSIPGIHINILTAAATDNTAAIKEFLAGNTDSTGIPQTYLEEYKNDPRTRQTTGSSNFKLNVNACDEETWEYLFGENGTITQNNKSDYWEVEPALSNSHFLKGLSLSIDRKKFADARGSIASVDFLSSNYMSNPEEGISYSTTAAHKAAVADLLEDTDGFGYNLELARQYFKLALEELVNEGVYEEGTRENPTVIELEIAWMYPQHENNYHNEIKQFFETAFNHNSVSGGKFKLDVKFQVCAEWSDVYYQKMLVGKFDIGFGSISGNPLNPLDFVSVLSSDPVLAGGFTLNWGKNTADPNADILVYKGLRWSYDALWQAANTSVVVRDGAAINLYGGTLTSHVKNADGSYTATIEVSTEVGSNYSVELTDIVLYWADYTDTVNFTDYKELSVMDKATKADGTSVYTVVIPADLVEQYKTNMGYNLYFQETIDGKSTTKVLSLTSKFE